MVAMRGSLGPAEKSNLVAMRGRQVLFLPSPHRMAGQFLSMPPAECPAGPVCRMGTYENEQISRSGRHRNCGPVGQLGSSRRRSRLPRSAVATHPLRVGVCAPGRLRPRSSGLRVAARGVCPGSGGVCPAGLLRSALGTTRLRLLALHLRSPRLERAWGLGWGTSPVSGTQAWREYSWGCCGRRISFGSRISDFGTLIELLPTRWRSP